MCVLVTVNKMRAKKFPISVFLLWWQKPLSHFPVFLIQKIESRNTWQLLWQPVTNASLLKNIRGSDRGKVQLTVENKSELPRNLNGPIFWKCDCIFRGHVPAFNCSHTARVIVLSTRLNCGVSDKERFSWRAGQAKSHPWHAKQHERDKHRILSRQVCTRNDERLFFLGITENPVGNAHTLAHGSSRLES